MIQLCKLLKLERINDCVVMTHIDGKDSFRSFIQLLNGGVVSGHACPDPGCVFVDVFVMGIFDPVEITNFTQEFFDGGRKSVASKIRK